MKKLILIIMVLVSIASYSNELIEAFASQAKAFSQSEEYINSKDDFLSVYDTLKENNLVEVDLLSADVKLSKTAWDFVSKEQKELTILVFLIYMYEKTQSTDLKITVDYTTVFWCSSGRIITMRVY